MNEPLVTAGADIDATYSDEWTPLHVAASWGLNFHNQSIINIWRGKFRLRCCQCQHAETNLRTSITLCQALDRRECGFKTNVGCPLAAHRGQRVRVKAPSSSFKWPFDFIKLVEWKSTSCVASSGSVELPSCAALRYSFLRSGHGSRADPSHGIRWYDI